MVDRVIYMLNSGEYESWPEGPFYGPPGIDIEALKLRYRTERHAAAEAAKEDWVSTASDGFAAWLVDQAVLTPIATTMLCSDMSTLPTIAYAPAHWKLCPSCEHGRGDAQMGQVVHALNAVEWFLRCTECGHDWDHHRERYLSDLPMLEEDGRGLDGGCVPFAIGKVGNLPIETVVDMCRKFGWREGSGIEESAALKAARALGISTVPVQRPRRMPSGQRLTLGRFLGHVDRARSYFIAVEEHWLAVVRGEVHDMAETGMGKTVLQAWEATVE